MRFRFYGWCLVAALCAGGFAGCQRARPSAPGGADRSHHTLAPVERGRGGTIRVLVSHDMEGLSGQSDWRTYAARFPAEFRTGQKLLAADVNAVIDGLFAGGAAAVDVVDQHGAGTVDSVPDIPPELLDPRARQVFLPTVITGAIAAARDYDALVTVGEHSKTGSGGFAAHTVDLGIELLMNGVSITEAEFKAYQWGEVGVPLIFVAGDDKLQHDLADIPWIEYVVTKHATSASSADLRPQEEVHAEMRAKAKRAVERLGEAMIMRLTKPISVTIKAVPPASLASLDGLPGINYAEEAVTFEADAIDSTAFDRMIAFMEVARLNGQYALLHETLQSTVDGRKLWSAIEEKYWIRWMDYESGRWKPLDGKAPTVTTR